MSRSAESQAYPLRPLSAVTFIDLKSSGTAESGTILGFLLLLRLCPYFP